MEHRPTQGEIIRLKGENPIQIITIAVHSETGEEMVVYQALYDDFKTFVKPLASFYREEIKQEQDIIQKNEFQSKVKISEGSVVLNVITKEEEGSKTDLAETEDHNANAIYEDVPEKINQLLMDFLDASSYNRKLEILTSNLKYLNNRMINDMAVSLDCTIDEGPLEQRIGELITCLKALCRFENRRLR